MGNKLKPPLGSHNSIRAMLTCRKVETSWTFEKRWILAGLREIPEGASFCSVHLSRKMFVWVTFEPCIFIFIVVSPSIFKDSA